MDIKEKHFWYILLVFILAASFFMNAGAAASAPIIFGDEGYFASRGEFVLQNLEIPKYFNIYTENALFHSFDLDFHFVIFAVSSFFALGGEFMVKILNPLLAVLTASVLFLFGRRFYSRKTGVLSVLFFLILPSVITYAVFLYADMLLTLFFISSVYFLVRGLKEDSYKYLAMSGILAGFSLLTKETGFLMVLVYLFSFLFYRKNWLKKFGFLLLIMLVFTVPLHLVHNFVLLGNPGLPVIGDYFPRNWQSPELELIDQERLELHSTGTYAGIFEYGVLNYVEFSYGLGLFVFIMLGLSYMLYRKNRDDVVILAWIAFLFALISYYTGGEGKVESLSRWLLPVMPFFALSAGLATEKVYDFLSGLGENSGKVFALLFVFIVVVFGLFSANAKASSLESIKEWSPAFVNGCDWIRRNTPEDSKIVNIWVHHGMYHCKRDTYWAHLPNKDSIVLFSNDTSYELLKEADMDYVYIQKFSVSFEKTAEAYPVEFVSYLKNSDNFEKVHEYPENCMMQAGNDCVVVYKIL